MATWSYGQFDDITAPRVSEHFWKNSRAVQPASVTLLPNACCLFIWSWKSCYCWHKIAVFTTNLISQLHKSTYNWKFCVWAHTNTWAPKSQDWTVTDDDAQVGIAGVGKKRTKVHGRML